MNLIWQTVKRFLLDMKDFFFFVNKDIFKGII